MVKYNEMPSLVGYRPAEAEEVAQSLGMSIRWVETTPPRWLSPDHEPRVGRQRVGDDGVLELLRVLVPTLQEEPVDSVETPEPDDL